MWDVCACNIIYFILYKIEDISDEADKIVELTNEKFDELTKSIPEENPNEEYKEATVAAIIMTKDSDDVSQDIVVAMGTGTKCIGGKKLNKMGTVINDCHAEVIARRALMRFFYDQLDLCVRLLLHLISLHYIVIRCRQGGSIFEKRSSGRYGLRQGTHNCI